MAKVVPVLIIKNSIEMMEYYQKMFGAKIVEVNHVDEGMLKMMEGQGIDTKPFEQMDLSKTNVHGTMLFGDDQKIFFNDDFEHQQEKTPTHLSLMYSDQNDGDEAEIRAIYERFASEGKCKILHPLAVQF